MRTTEKIADVLSVDEFKESLGQFSEAKRIKLGKSAEYLCWGLSIDGPDLLQVALCKALEGERKCPRGVPIEVFVYRAMESLVSAYLKKRAHDPLHLAIQPKEEDDPIDLDGLQPAIDTPEELLLAKQTLEALDHALQGDESMVVMAQLDGYSPQQIQEAVGLNPTEYASALRAIRRKVDKLAK